MTDHFLLGMVIILVGGALNGSFVVPMKYARTWRWENIWLVFSLISLVIFPWGLAEAFVPHLGDLYKGLASRTLLLPLAFGLLWGVAQLTFGLGIKAVGMALAFAVVSGISCLSGSLVPLLVFNPKDLFRPRGLLLFVSMPILFLGLFLYANAGRRREKEQLALNSTPQPAEKKIAAGLAICVFAGILGSSFNLGFAFSGEITRRSVDLGAGQATSTYSVWALVLGAGFVANLLYCVRQLFKNQSWSMFAQSGWLRDSFATLLMAALWLGGILAYGTGTKLVGLYGTSLGFALFTCGQVLSANLMGIVAGEWKCTSAGTRKLLAGGVAAILTSVVVLSLGGFIGEGSH
jgi:L-rhamnose-H+ transport protein